MGNCQSDELKNKQSDDQEVQFSQVDKMMNIAGELTKTGQYQKALENYDTAMNYFSLVESFTKISTATIATMKFPGWVSLLSCIVIIIMVNAAYIPRNYISGKVLMISYRDDENGKVFQQALMAETENCVLVPGDGEHFLNNYLYNRAAVPFDSAEYVLRYIFPYLKSSTGYPIPIPGEVDINSIMAE